MLSGLTHILNAEVQASRATHQPDGSLVLPRRGVSMKLAGGGKESLSAPPPQLRQILSSEITATVHKVRKCAQLENSVISEGGESHLGGHLVHG